nr:hypothetical protein [Tanacetum cinerariifolium]
WITLRFSVAFDARYGRHLQSRVKIQRSRIAYRLPLPVTPEGHYLKPWPNISRPIIVCRDTVQLETVVSTISQEYLLEFTTEYGISEDLHPKLPGPEERIADFPEGKVDVYTKFFEFANFRLPLSQFHFDILGHYQIYFSQLSVIGAAKVSHFEINFHVLNIVPTLSLFHLFYILSFNSGWMSFSKRPGKNTPQCYTKPLDSLKNQNNRFFWVDKRVFPTVADWRTSAPKDEMPVEDTYSLVAVTVLNTHRTPIQKHPEALLCLVGLSRRYFLGDDVYPTFLHDDDQDMNLFNLIHAPNPTKVKTGTHPRDAHEVPLLTIIASRVIEMKDPAAATDSSGKALAEEIASIVPRVIKERCKRGNDGVDLNAPPKVLRRDHSDSQPTHSTIGGKSLAVIGLGMGSTCHVPMSRDTPVDVSDSDPLSFANPLSIPTENVAQSFKGAAIAGDPESENTSFTFMVGSPESIYQPKWGVTNGYRLDAPEACQDLVDHIVPPGFFSELRHLYNDDFLKQYNINLERQVTMGSQLRLRFKQEAKLLKKSVAQQVSTLQAQVTGEEKLKAVFEEFKKYENDRVEKRCAEIDARLDALSIDIDEELYPHMLTAIAGRRWVVGYGLRLAVMNYGKLTELRQVFVDVVSAGIAKANAKYVVAHHALRDLKYPMVDQLENLKDALIDVIMASLHLESGTGDDALQGIRELCPSSSQLKIPVYQEVRDHKDPWAFKEEVLLADAIAINVSRAEKKKKF